MDNGGELVVLPSRSSLSRWPAESGSDRSSLQKEKKEKSRLIKEDARKSKRFFTKRQSSVIIYHHHVNMNPNNYPIPQSNVTGLYDNNAEYYCV